MNGLAAQVGPRFHVLGSEAGYAEWGLDSQEPALAAGMTPSDPAYGVDPEEAWGCMRRRWRHRNRPTQQAHYAGVLHPAGSSPPGRRPLPVDPAESLEVLKVIDTIRAFA